MKSALLIRDRQFYGNILSLAFPIVLQQLLRLSVDTVNSVMLGSIDQLQMTAVSQADQVFFIYYTICNGFAIGCCVLVAQYWGQRNMEAIRTVLGGIALLAGRDRQKEARGQAYWTPFCAEEGAGQ